MLVSVFLCLLLFGAFLVPATAAEENWTSFRGNPDNIARTDTALPLPDAAVLSYRYSLKASDDWATNVSEPLFYDGHLVIAWESRGKGKLHFRQQVLESQGHGAAR